MATASIRSRIRRPEPSQSEGYKWIALSNVTLAVLLATIDLSITIIAMPDIFRGIRLDPLAPATSFYLLWMILGYMVVSSVLIVGLGRLGDIFGRVRIYNLGFVIFTVFSILLSVTWLKGSPAAIWLIVMRIFQALGAAMLVANSAAILTDAFPSNQRGLALGINNIAGIAGSTINIYGTDFCSSPSVTFNGSAATVVSASLTQIVVTVPSGATTGPMLVTCGSNQANLGTFTIASNLPSISSFSPILTPITGDRKSVV